MGLKGISMGEMERGHGEDMVGEVLAIRNALVLDVTNRRQVKST
jgi:hypothetical protein